MLIIKKNGFRPFFVSAIMSKNNTIKKSDKKFIRREKARIRSQFLDFKKQEEMIAELYKRFLKQPVQIESSIKIDKETKKEKEEVKSEKVVKSKKSKIHPVK